MKNLNLIERLLSYSHEKQSPQRFGRYAVMLILFLTCIPHAWAACDMSGMDHVRLATYENSSWNYREFTDNGSGHFTYDVYLPANTSYDCQWNIYKYGGNWTNTWYIWDGANDNPYTARSGDDTEVARMCFWGNSSAHGTSNSFTTATASSGYTHLYVDFWGKYYKNSNGWAGDGIGIRFWYAEVANLSPSLEASTGTSKINPRTTSTITASCTGGSESYNYSYVVTCGGDNVTASTLSATSGSSVTFTAPAAATEKTYRITVTASDANSQLSGLASQTAYKDITVKATGTPTVTLNVDKINVNQIKVTGTITGYANYGSTADDMSEVGFYFGNTKYTTTYTSGSSFTKTITGLTANTSYDIKAFATNPCHTGYSDVAATTTLANATYRVKVRVDHGDPAPHLYAWRDADGYGGTGAANAASFEAAPSMTLLFAATTYDWYYYDVHNEYEKFLFYKTGSSDQTDDFAATRTDDCFWYDESKGTKEARAAKMTCPVFETQLVVKTGEDETQTDMTGSGTVTLDKYLSAGTHSIKVLYNTEYYGKASSSIARTGSTSSNSIGGMVVNGAYITLTADLAGTYTFSFNTSTKTLSVSYPEAYQVNFSAITIGGGTGYSAAPTASYNSGATTVTSGTTWIPTGTTVNFSAKSANAGYTFMGWYSTNTPNPASWSTNRLIEAAAYSPTINSSAVKTIYAVYDENDYTVTVGATTGGSITTPASPATTITAHPGTATSIVAALDNLAWRFKGWVKTVGSGNVTFGSASSLSTNVKTTSNATIQAQFEPRYGLIGSRNGDGDANQGMPGWTNGSAADFTVEDFDAINTDNGVDLECTRTLLPNRQYKFMVYDRVAGTRRGCTSENNNNNAQVLPAGSNWQLNGTYQVLINTVGYGDYTFHITKMGASSTYYPSLQVDRPTSHQLTLGSKTTYLDGSDSGTATEGGTVYAQTTESGENFTITNGQYVADDGTITFTANPTKGYEVEWYKDAAYTLNYSPSGSIYGKCSYSITNSGNTLTLSNIKDDVTVYAKFVEKKCRVNVYTAYNSLGSVSINGEATSWSLATVDVGVHTTATIAVTPETNYYVDSLCKAYGAENFEYTTYSVTSSNTSATIRGTGEGSSANIRARINELDRIYFYNYNFDTRTNLWTTGHVYVYFNVPWGTWSSSDDGVVTHDCTMHTEMSPVWAGSYYYWAYVPRAFMLETGSNKTKVAFSDVDMSGNNVFYGNHGVFRSDYNRILNMFVPHHTSSGTSNSTVYNSNGYWKQYNPTGGEGAGYYLQLHTGTNTYSQQGEFKAESNSINSKLAFTMRVDNIENQTQYRIISAGGIYYTTAGITSTACTDVEVNEYKDCSNCYLTLTLTAEGDYKFILDQSGEKMKLSVEYPIGQDDYRLKHSYVIRNKANTADSTVYTYSDIIKARDAASSNTVSMYLNDGGTETLVLQKCTDVDAGVPQWSDGYSDNLGGVLTALRTSGNGVYQFDVKINTSTDQLSEAASNIGLYEGNYYIKTNSAYGMWADYHSNVMGKNTETFSTEKPETFDYYYCAFATGNTNVKCVVANAYNNALCDTLLGDAVIGMGNQALPNGKSANIRFSYNSYTNEVKRTYMNGSAYSGDEYLLLQGDAMIADTTGTRFTDDKVTFVDHEDWVYIVDVKAKETARARLTANYNNHLQYLIGSDPYGKTWETSTEVLLGGTTEHTDWNPIRIIYDFKTNHLISAWVATADIAVGAGQNKAINADMMLIRENQGAAHQITFADTDAKLSEVKTVYGVLKLTKSHVQNYSLPSSQREFYWVSFPFDVDLSQSFGGLGYYGTDWAMEYYDGKTRAKYGYWADSDVNWKIMWDKDTILHAYEGYVLALELGNFQSNYMWPNNSTEIFQYFPSKEPVNTISQATVEVEFPNQSAYYCNINRTYGSDGDRRVKDSYWHCIGVPGYANYEAATQGAWDDVKKEATAYNPELSLPYVYVWRPATNDYEVVTTGTYNFEPMTSYLVQYSKDIMTWTNVNAPASIVARRRSAAEIRECEFKLSLSSNNTELDRTFIRMSDDEGITAGFEFNYDLSKAMNANKANIYTLIGYEPVAGNIMPLDLEQTTVVPVGVKIATDGDYTFAMPEGTSGVGVILIDNITGARTNLGLTNYTVNLTAGKIEGRFSLEISPLAETPTGIGNVQGDNVQDSVRKVMVDGILYIVKDGVVFDACGNRVE